MDEIFRFVALRPPQALSIEAVFPPATANLGSRLRTELEQALHHANARGAIAAAASAHRASGEHARALTDFTLPLVELDRAMEALDAPDLPTVEAAIERALGQPAAAVVGLEGFAADRAKAADSLIAECIAGSTDSAGRQETLARAVRLLAVIALVAERDPPPTAQAVRNALVAPVLLPESLFPLPPETPSTGMSAEAGERLARAGREAEAVRAEARMRVERLEAAKRELRRLSAEDVARPEPAAFREPNPHTTPTVQRAGVEAGAPWRLSSHAVNRLSGETRAVLAELGVSLNPTPLPAMMLVLDEAISAAVASVVAVASGEAIVPVGAVHVPASALQEAPVATFSSGTGGAFRAVGVAELETVQQEILKYEAGEVAHIENVLSGESKTRTHSTRTTTEVIETTETEITEETEQDLQSTERFELQAEAENTVRNDLRFETELTLKYGGVIDVTSNTKFAYERASEETSRSARKHAREIVERSVSRLKERVRKERVTKTLREVEERNIHRIDNSAGQGHRAGIYRWVDKTYRARVLNYGMRTMFEFIVPEPAAFLLYARSSQPPEGVTLTRPDAPLAPDGSSALMPQHLKASNYQQWVAQYGVAGVKPAPAERYTEGFAWQSPKLEKHQSTSDLSNRGFIIEGQVNDKLRVEKGYAAKKAYVMMEEAPHEATSATGVGTRYETFITVNVGDRSTHYLGYMSHYRRTDVLDLGGLVGDVPVTIASTHPTVTTVIVQLHCELTEDGLNAWRQDTYDAILQAYLNLKADYEDQLAAAKVADGVSISGGNPKANRATEQVELKRGALTLLTRKTSPHFRGSGSVATVKDTANDYWGYPEIDFDEADREAPYIQFLEQAFEWQQMMYTFYPYYWARRKRWPLLQQLTDTDPQHAEFLKAGAARVLVPVRPGYDESLFYYLDTGKLWNGAGPPSVTSALYLPIVTEIREKQGLYFTKREGTVTVAQGSKTVTGKGTAFARVDVGREIMIEHGRYRVARVIREEALELDQAFRGTGGAGLPYAMGSKIVGDPWEVTLPTTLVLLQQDAELPDFTATTS